MSFKYMAMAAEKKTGSPTKKLILLLLADRANDSGKCYPSLDTISADCELSKSAVVRNIKLLAEMGLIEIIHRSEGNVKLSNIYVLHLGGVVAQSYGGSSSKPTKPINEPYSLFFTDLWKRYGILAKDKKFQIGDKQKAKSSFDKLLQKVSEKDIERLVEIEAQKDYGYRHLVTIFNDGRRMMDGK